MKIALAFALLFGSAVSADTGPKMRCRVVVPKEYRTTPWDPPPNGEPEPIRYKVAYEAFWWNCVTVRAADPHGRCPFLASGTPAATAGATDGARNAEAQIEKLSAKYSQRSVRHYLRIIAARPLAKEKMKQYFDKPTPEVVK